MAIEVQHDFWGTLSAIGIGIIGVAALAAVVSKNSNTTAVITAGGQAYTNSLAAALSPVTGGSSSGINTSTFPIS
jgi:hypothetical protein